MSDPRDRCRLARAACCRADCPGRKGGRASALPLPVPTCGPFPSHFSSSLLWATVWRPFLYLPQPRCRASPAFAAPEPPSPSTVSSPRRTGWRLSFSAVSISAQRLLAFMVSEEKLVFLLPGLAGVTLSSVLRLRELCLGPWRPTGLSVHAGGPSLRVVRPCGR